MKKLIVTLFLLFSTCAIAQNVGIGTTTPDASAKLDVVDPNRGMLIPRVALTSTNNPAPITSPATSLLVYNTATAGSAPNNVTPGYYYWNGASWVRLLEATTNTWQIYGNAGTIDGTHFLGTTDNVPLNFRVNNQKAGRIGLVNDGSVFLGYQAGNSDDYSDNRNHFIGYEAGFSNTSGYNNIALGYRALRSNTTSNNNIAIGNDALFTQSLNSNGNHDNLAIGYEALYSNQPTANNNGWRNTAIGNYTLRNNTVGYYNTAVGTYALFQNTGGITNTAIGVEALRSNTFGGWNTAIGVQALYSNTTQSFNTACGYQALYNNIANDNSAFGYQAMYSNTTGGANCAFGYQALYSNVNGGANDAFGYKTLYSNISGGGNVAFGYEATYSNTTGMWNSSVGRHALYNNVTGSHNVALGYEAGKGSSGVNFEQCTFVGAGSTPIVSRTNVTMLGYGIADGQCTGDNQVLLGNTAINQIRAQVTGITAYSDKCFKTNIREDVPGLAFINRLKPVTYNTNPLVLHKIWGTSDSLLKTIDHTQVQNTRFVGFLAQDVHEAAKQCGWEFPGLDVPHSEKDVYTLRYVDFIMPLVKSVQELSKENDLLKNENTSIESKLEQQKRILEEQNKKLDEQQKQIDLINAHLGIKAQR